MKRLVSLSLLALAALSASAVTNDLVITSITRQNNCTSLTWNSHPGEFYTVQWTDNLTPPIFWRVAEVNVPSQGTNTIWWEGGCSQTLMAGGGGSESSASDSAESQDSEPADEKATIPMVVPKDESRPPVPLGIYPPGFDLTGYIIIWPDGSTEEWSEEVVEKWRESHRDDPQPEDGGEENTVEARFYRVVRTAVLGMVDGWSADSLQIPSGLTNIFAVSAGGAHCLAVRSNGSVVAWGNNSYGQSNVPTNLADVVSVAGGWYHSVALKRDGSLALWGADFLGQITNTPAGLTNVVDVKAGGYHTIALKADGTVAAWGAYFPASNAVPAGLNNVVAIAAGSVHCLALKNDGTVTGWAFWPGSWPTNAPSTLTNAVAITAGQYQNYALLKSGEVVTWNNGGFLTNPPAGFSNVAAISASPFSGIVLNNDTTLTGWGGSQVYQGLTNVATIASGGAEFSARWLCIVTDTNSVVIRQQPQSGSIPLGQSTNLSVVATGGLPISYQWQQLSGTNWADLTGATNSTLSFTNFQDANDGMYRVRVTNTVSALFSSNATLIAMHAPTITNQSPALEVRTPQGSSVTLTVGAYAKGSSSFSYTWYHGTSALPGPSGASRVIPCQGPLDEGSYRVVVSNAAGSATSAWWQVTITLQGEATGWGNNSYGQANRFATETNFVAVSAGGYHTLGLRENGTVLAWGNNFYGQTNVPSSATNVAAIAAGQYHNLALRENGSVVAWGDNTYGQTNGAANLTNAIAVAAGGFHSLALRQDSTVAGWGSSAGTIPNGLSNVTAVAAGYGHSIALLGNGSVVCWGDNSYGQTNAPADLTNAVAIAAGVYHSLAIRADGSVVGWGANSTGEATPPSNLTNAIAVAAGYQYSLALRNDGAVVLWGTNTFGPTNVPAGLGDTYAVSAGYYHAVALAYAPVLNYPVSVSRHVLLVYNATSADSINVGNYYLQNRPKFAVANFTGISCTNGEILARSDFTNQVLNPILQWLTDNPTKRPAHLVFSFGLPWRFEHSETDTNLAGSIAYELRRRLPYRTPFITQLNMATTNDCVDYIDKLAAFGAYLPLNRALIRASDASFATETFVLDNVRDSSLGSYANSTYLRNARDSLLALGVQTNNILYADNWAGINYSDYWPVNTNHIRNATNTAAYVCWGIHGFWPYSWPTNVAGDGQPYIAMRGNTGWHIMQSIESFNGLGIPYAVAAGHSSFQMWFSSGALGGSNYASTPAGAVSHVDEPYLGGINDTSKYFGAWFSGKSFAIAAWTSTGQTPVYGYWPGPMTIRIQATGDPLVAK